MQEEAALSLQESSSKAQGQAACLGPPLTRLAVSSCGKLAVASGASAVVLVALQPTALHGVCQLPKVQIFVASL